MSEAVSALAGATFDGLVQVHEAGVEGMITLRTQADNPQLAVALRDVAAVDMPPQRGIVAAGETAVAWMSPDEWLVMLPYGQAQDGVARLRSALAGTHHLVENVSDARALFVLSGEDARLREVLAKLAPVDLHPDRFGPGEMRRTRLAQVPGAIWMPQAGQARVVCFRSVARYVFDLLSVAASPGSSVDHFG
ncbi:sarcosine oxidase subunit gamma [Lacimonas salitolerans]|uniref:Sarcosine oxidase subunit gamma n=1 Tax=Lacimonas salitolerans TaxID=1323750 RepID=A0ABW4EBV6_9RHOB